MRVRYLSRVGSLAMHSFSIYPATTFESVQRVHLWTPMAISNMVSYSAMLLVHLFALLLNCNLVA
jgi:hypothetical protein